MFGIEGPITENVQNNTPLCRRAIMTVQAILIEERRDVP
jgi:hypothetical protein